MRLQRKFFVGGNWKLNGTKAANAALIKELNAGDIPSSVEVVVSPPSIYIDQVVGSVDSAKIAVSVQNIHSESKGAFTGEISAEQALDSGARFAILGHSERRDIFGESDALIAKKVVHSLSVGLAVIFCLGEHLKEREDGTTIEVVYRQLKAVTDSLKSSPPEVYNNLVIAYEPVWAIGTGKTASPQQAQDVHEQLRKLLAENVDQTTASKTRIIYGGSVNAQNATELAKQPDIDGFLVGGASLKSADFLTIIKAGAQ